MRYDRIYELRNLVSYVNSDSFDKVFYYPQCQSKLRIWLISKAAGVEVCIDEMSFSPKKIISDNNFKIIDYGIIADNISGFRQLRVKNITYNELQESYLIITPKTDFVPSGTIENIQRSLWGLARCDAGISQITPAIVPVRDGNTFTVTYTSTISLPPNSRLRFSVPFAFSQPQSNDPQKDGYITLLPPFNDNLPVSICKGDEGHEKYLIIYCLKDGLPANTQIQVRYSTSNVYMYPQKYCENEMIYWYTRTPVLNVSVAAGDYGEFVFLDDINAHCVEFCHQKAQKLCLTLPGRVHMGKEIILKGVFTDKYNNFAYVDRPNMRFSLELEKNQETVKLESPMIEYTNFSSFRVKLPISKVGVYRVTAFDENGCKIAISNPLQILSENDSRNDIYWGEIHAHCVMSDGTGEYSELFRHAREYANLDFAASADHACYFSDNEWEMMQDICNSYNKEESFVTLIGYEWAGQQVHRNIYTHRNRLKLFRGMYKPTSTLNVVYDEFSGDESVVAGPHGSIAHGIKFEHHNEKVERFIEMYSMWGGQDYIGNEHNPVEISYLAIGVNDLIKNGAHFGFTGGGDCHEGHPGFSCFDEENQGILPHSFAQLLRYRCGITASCMPKLNRVEMINALRNRHTYATTGARMLADFTLNGYQMGEIVKLPVNDVNIRCELHLCANESSVYVIKNGINVYSQKLNGYDIVFNWQDKDLSDEENSYYLKVVQSDYHSLWTSPIWVHGTYLD